MAVIEGNGFSYALENRLIKKLDIMIDRTIRDKPKLDAWLAIEGAEGCLAGDTELIIRRKIEGRKGVFRKYKLKDLYYAKHSFNKNISSYIRSYNCSKIKYTKIKDITYSGLKKTYLLTLENKLNIRATATHKFLTGFRASKIGDWKRLKDLKVGEPIMYEGIEGTTKRIPKFSKISSIKENNILEETYDIECERFHCFSANGIIVHNSGKSNTACASAYYVKLKTGKDIHLFFRLEPLIRMAQQTEGKIFIWDEPSLDSLSTDQLKTVNRNLLRLAMTIRKKRHFFFINFTKFWKFSEYIVVDRCLGMIHMYSKNEIEMGKSVYIKKKNLEKLWNEYNKSKRRSYGKFRAFFASFPEIMMENMEKMGIFVDGKPNATYADYERAKDRAINSIGKDEKPKSKKEGKYESLYAELRRRISNLDPRTIKTKEDIAKSVGVNRRTLTGWAYAGKEESYGEDKEAKKLGLDDNFKKGSLTMPDDDEDEEEDEQDDIKEENTQEDNDEEDVSESSDNEKPNWKK